jgi:carbon storage regulator
MLVLSRRLGESIKIGNDITVTVLSATGAQVRLGIAAPEAIPVHREEVYRRIRSDSRPPDRAEDSAIEIAYAADC